MPNNLVSASGPGFAIGVPKGWRHSTQGNSDVWTDPASSAYIQVDRTGWTGDPYDHWFAWEREAIADGKLKGFHRVGDITRTEVAGTGRQTSSSPGPAAPASPGRATGA